MLSFLWLCLHSLTTLPRRELRGEEERSGWAARQAQDERHLGKLKLPVVARWLWPPLPHGAAVAGGREHISASRSRTGRARTTSWPSVRARVGQAEPTTTITCPARWATCAMRARVDYAYVPDAARKGMPWLALMLINVSVCRSLRLAVFLTC